MNRALGVVANLLGIVCVAVALIKHETAGIELVGALDRNPVVLGQPSIAIWLIAAAVLVAIGTAVLLRSGAAASRTR